MHLGQLELGLRADSTRKRSVADHVAESLSMTAQRMESAIEALCAIVLSIPGYASLPEKRLPIEGRARFIPFGFGLLEGHALIVVPNQASVGESREIKLLWAEKPCHFRHFGAVD